MEIEICYQDAFIIGVNKPCNVLVHHSYMARNLDSETTLLDLLEVQLNQKFFPLHRLDRKTSGLILLAKNRKDVSSFQDLFIHNKIEKTYYALVRGYAPDSGIIDSPVKGRDSNVYKEAATEFKKLNEITLEIPVHPYPNSRYSLLELKPKTGRLHQLRIHLNKISHPIIGDPKYGDRFHNRMFSSNFMCSQMFLHALSLEFTHPITNQNVIVKSTLPVFWIELFDDL
jgi:tRNA pseudouridine65 synthase